MIKNYIVMVLLFMAHALGAQNRVSGLVTDNENRPIIGASVYIHELNKGVVSNHDGEFLLLDLPNGKHRIQFSYLGYESVIETIIITDKVPIRLDVPLVQTTIETEEIVVTGGFNATQHENAVKIETIKIETLNNQPTPNFTELIAKTPGVDMISKGSGVSKPVIRGLSMNDILVLNNGVRYENYQYSSHHPLGIDEFGISKVEIIKGPASLLYGSDAIGGVINILKENPAPVGTFMGDYNLQMFSNSLGVNNNVGFKGASKKVFGGVRIGHKTHADYLQGEGEYVPNTRSNEYSLKTNLGLTTKAGVFKVNYDYSEQKLGLAEEHAIEDITDRGCKNELFYQQLNTHLLSSQNKLYLGVLKLDLNAAFQSTNLAHIGESDEYEIEMRLNTITYESKLHLLSNEQSDIIIGLQGMNQQNQNINEREVILLPNSILNGIGGFGLAQQLFGEKFRLQAGVRYDYKDLQTDAVGVMGTDEYRELLNKDYGSFSGSLGATYQVTDELLVRANIASAYRTPNLAELTSNGPHEARYEVGNSNLKPQISNEIDASLHYHSDNMTIDVAGYYNVIDDYISIAPTGEESNEGLPIYQYSQSNSYLYGGESGLHLHPKALKWLHIETTYSTVVGKKRSAGYLALIPADKLNFDVMAEKDKMLFLYKPSVAIRMHNAFAQNNSSENEEATKGYTLFDVMLGAQMKMKKQMLLVSVGVKNVFDTKYVDHLSMLKEVGFYNPGRNLSLVVKVPF